MLIETASQPLTRALTNSVQTDLFAYPPVDGSPSAQVAEPGQGLDPGSTGVYSAGLGGDRTANRLYLVPFGAGDRGAGFSMRVYGWRDVGGPAGLWFPTVLCELACVLSNQTGPLPGPPRPSSRLLAEYERLCDTIVLTRGQVGLGGYVSNTGQDLAAYAFIDLCGCRKFQFDFQRSEESDVVMNCFWARA